MKTYKTKKNHPSDSLYKNKILVHDVIASGEQGSVYNCTDIFQPLESLVMKKYKKNKIMQEELEILNKL